LTLTNDVLGKQLDHEQYAKPAASVPPEAAGRPMRFAAGGQLCMHRAPTYVREQQPPTLPGFGKHDPANAPAAEVVSGRQLIIEGRHLHQAYR
jgi:hypothetical protein